MLELYFPLSLSLSNFSSNKECKYIMRGKKIIFNLCFCLKIYIYFILKIFLLARAANAIIIII